MTRQLHLSVSYDGAATWPAVRSLVAEAAAWQNSRFRNFPEFVQHRFESAPAVPLRAPAGVAGTVNFCRRAALPYEPDAILAASIGRSVGQLVARSSVCPSAVTRFPIENEVLSDSEANHVR